MGKSSYNPYFSYNFSQFGIVEIQTDNTLILVDNNFANKKKKVIKIS